MTVPNIPTGDFVLPVCVSSQSDIVDLLSALDLYRKLRKKSEDYPIADAVYNALEYADNPQDSPCLDVETGGTGGACYRMDTSTEIFDFYPNDPFNASDTSQTIIGGSWITLDKILGLEIVPDWMQNLIDTFGELVGYFPNDCFITYLDDDFPRIPDIKEEFFQFLDNLSNVIPFPTVTIKLQGSGQADLEFPIVPLGGRVIIFKDFEPNLNDINDVINGNFQDISLSVTIIEVERDLLSTTPELIPTTVVELDFQEDKEHTIRCVFIPSVEPDQAPFIFPFGGIREIEVCGNIEVIGSQTDTVYNSLNYRLNSHREGIIMTTKQDICEGVICALETVSSRIVSGQAGNIANAIEIGTSGGITVKSGGSGTPAPVVNATNQEIYYGGVYNQAEQLQQIFSNVAIMKANGFTASSIAKLALSERNILNYADWLTELTAYANGSLAISIDTQELALLINCNGYENAVIQYAINELSEAEADIFTFVANNIDVSTRNNWFDVGTARPRDGYQSSACYRIPNETVLFDVDLLTTDQYAYFSSQQMLSAPREWRFEFSGSVTNSNGEVWDGLYLKQGNTITYTPPTIRRDPALTLGLVIAPSYNPQHVYSVQTDDNTSVLHRIDYVGYSNNTLVDEFRAIGGLSGQIQVTKIDLGAG